MTAPVFVRRERHALFAREDIACRYCERRGTHAHLVDISDLSAAEILALSTTLSMADGRTQSDFEEAREDLEEQYPGVYSTERMARRALEAERDEDEGRGRDDRGRRVA